MNSVRVLCWLPASLCDELSAALQGALAPWASTWGLPTVGQVRACLLDAAAASSSDLVDLLAPSATSLPNALALALFKVGAGESAIVDAVVRRMVDQLARQLEARFPQASPIEPPAKLPGHRGIRITVDMLGQRCGIELGLSQLRMGGWLKATTPTTLGPVDLERAAGELPVPLVAELGRASVSVSDLVQLMPGDVLLLEEALDAPLRVVSPECSLALAAHLGAFANPPQRAARLLAS